MDNHGSAVALMSVGFSTRSFESLIDGLSDEAIKK